MLPPGKNSLQIGRGSFRMRNWIKTHLDINSLSILGNFSTEQVVFSVLESFIFVRNFPAPGRLNGGEKPLVISLPLWAGGG